MFWSCCFDTVAWPAAAAGAAALRRVPGLLVLLVLLVLLLLVLVLLVLLLLVLLLLVLLLLLLVLLPLVVHNTLSTQHCCTGCRLRAVL
jgi:hypothetical protein